VLKTDDDVGVRPYAANVRATAAATRHHTP